MVWVSGILVTLTRLAHISATILSPLHYRMLILGMLGAIAAVLQLRQRAGRSTLRTAGLPKWPGSVLLCGADTVLVWLRSRRRGNAKVRAWARGNCIRVAARGTISAEALERYNAAH